ncbi:hypothetical protein F1188_08615 [Roseospira marina]|uniref:Motility protein B-like N-terminal domain-containing protein n=1 Tax=Roseospira marina TaxID=140057 RepID=A0A5M6ICS3_9PROT|nr:hypothetical protein [Roseospira marina]KAA5606061.1 hypothetical protein F1188_08615 [Roseospira marina]MBB4313075.1 hypothetical protein [Roseospira marina]MBB5086184.1 hypothetical protein [Roseospira marina]
MRGIERGFPSRRPVGGVRFGADARATSPGTLPGTSLGLALRAPKGGATGRCDGDLTGWAAAPVARGSLALFLALYLLLLAFFIMLMALSSLEGQRARAVMESLTVTFSHPQETTDVVADMPMDDLDGNARAAEAFIALVTDLFDAALPTVRVRHLVAGRSIEVMMRGDSLFEPEAATLRPAQVLMLDELVAALSAPPDGLRFEMAAVVQTGAGMPEAEADPSLSAGGASGPDARDGFGVGSVDDRGAFVPLPVAPDALALQRAAALGRVMTARGAVPGSVLVGLSSGDPAWLRLTFRAVDVTRWDPDFRDIPADAIPVDEPDPDPNATPASVAPSFQGGAPGETGFRAAQPGAASARVSTNDTTSPPAADSESPAAPQRTQP